MAPLLKDSLRNKRLYLLDMDGTLYLGSRLFPCTLPFLEAVRSSGARYLFLTNNSSRGTDSYVKKLQDMGIAACAEDFFTSTDTACAYLRAHYRGRKIYVLGTASFKNHLKGAGFPITDRLEDDIDCLLMGYDTELTYQKLVDASILLGRNVTYLATNPDWVCPTAFGYVPDCGSMAQALEHATGRLPVFLGKPQPEIALLAMEKAGVTPEETVLVGDRIYTDIACGKNAGVASILVLSGETTREIMQASKVQPDFVLEDVGDITAALHVLFG